MGGSSPPDPVLLLRFGKEARKEGGRSLGEPLETRPGDSDRQTAPRRCSHVPKEACGVLAHYFFFFKDLFFSSLFLCTATFRSGVACVGGMYCKGAKGLRQPNSLAPFERAQNVPVVFRLAEMKMHL